MIQFPKNFVWGTATSSYQIEGAVQEEGRGESIWDAFCRKPGAVANGDTGDIACDHYHRVDEDVDLLVKLGVKAYRFSTAWPRVIPSGSGPVNAKGLAFYDRLVDTLLAHGIEPWLTLYHWDLPQALQEKGGWTNRDILGWFEDYAHAVVKALGDRVSNYMILNEPSVMAYQGHLEGSHAPGIQSLEAYAACAHHQNLVIGHTYRLMKELKPSWKVGSSYTHFPVRAIDDAPENARARDVMDAIWNRAFFDPLFKGSYPEILAEHFEPLVQSGDLERTKTNLDFVGIQHYSPSYAKYLPETLAKAGFVAPPAGTPVTDMNWPVDPPAFYETLMDMKNRYGNPEVLITENGAAYADVLSAEETVKDSARVEHYRRYLTQVDHAIQDGANITGYFAWSFLDNFEWAWGYDKRFGIVYVDYQKGAKRIPKDSFHWYADVVRQNALRES